MNVFIGDIETLRSMFLLVVYTPKEDKWEEFEVSRRKNDLDRMVNWFYNHSSYYWVSYNGLRFDSQVVEWIIRNYEWWHNDSVDDVIKKIYQKAQDVIDDANYELFPEYREEHLTVKQVDLFKVLHLDNKHRRIGLKSIEFQLDMENIEEMPIHHSVEYMTDEQLEVTVKYCINDVLTTYHLYLLTRGDTTHPLYKGDDKIQLRFDIQEEFGIYCLNYSDSKIGDEIVKKYYCEQKKISYDSLPKKGFFRKKVDAKNCIAKYIDFKTPQLQQFLKTLKKKSFSMADEFKETIHFYGNEYSFMKGGLHTKQNAKAYYAEEGKLIIDFDVASFYPAIIINNEQYPHHLGREFLVGYKKMFEKRIALKPLSKTNKKIKGIVNALKLSVNSVYGKSSDVQSWLYDRQLTLFTTLTGELSLMMLIEAYELAGIHVISANTDGVTLFTDESNVPTIEQINDWWMCLTQYELERTDYSFIVFSTVNDYIALKTDGEVKKKGDMITDFEVYKNKSARIVPIALEEYFINNIPVEQTINSHKNIYDFCIRQKASRDFHYEGINKLTGERSIYNKLIRYYVAKDGLKLFKIKNPECTTNAPQSSQIEAGEWVCHVCNFLPKDAPMDNIDYSYYIQKANEIIYKIDTGGKKLSNKKIDENQLSLW